MAISDDNEEPMRVEEKDILIVSTGGGCGHTRAAEAILLAMEHSGLPLRGTHFDVFDLLYTFSNEAPAPLAERSQSILTQMKERGAGWSQDFAFKSFLNLLTELECSRCLDLVSLSPRRFDAVVCTNSFPYHRFAPSVRRNSIKAPIFAVVTDLDVGHYWVDPVVQRYYVHDENSVSQLISFGVPREKIESKGIPLVPGFYQRIPRSSARQALGIDKSKFVFLLISGGMGERALLELVHQLMDILSTVGKGFCLLVVCGRNEKLRCEFDQVNSPGNVDLHVFGFVQDVFAMMDAADVFISKPGGLSCAEAMAKGIPMIIVNPIRNCGIVNAEVVVNSGGGWKAADTESLRKVVNLILSDEKILDAARKKAQKLGRPRAAIDIVMNLYSAVCQSG